MQYNTKNKKAIMSFFKENGDEWYTAEQVAEAMGEIGRSTVYRIVSELSEAGLILREHSEKLGCAVYKGDNRNCREHFHLRCIECGKYVHIEDKKTEELISAIAKDNEFSIDKGKTVLYGMCEKCRGANKK